MCSHGCSCLSLPALRKASGCTIRLVTHVPRALGIVGACHLRECFSRPDGAHQAIGGWVGGGRDEALPGGREAVSEERRPLPAHVEGK